MKLELTATGDIEDTLTGWGDTSRLDAWRIIQACESIEDHWDCEITIDPGSLMIAASVLTPEDFESSYGDDYRDTNDVDFQDDDAIVSEIPHHIVVSVPNEYNGDAVVIFDVGSVDLGIEYR